MLTNAGNTYSGKTNIDTGTLKLSGAGTIASSSEVVNNGVLDISDATSNVQVTTLSGSGDVILGAKDLIITNGSGAYAGSFEGTGGVKLDGGSLILSGGGTYSGGLEISNGAHLTVASETALGNADVVLTGGSLATATNITLAQTLSVAPQTVIDTNADTVFTVTTPIASIAGGGNGCFVKQGAGSLVMSRSRGHRRGYLRAGWQAVRERPAEQHRHGSDRRHAAAERGIINGATTVYGRIAPGNSPGTLLAAAPVTMTAGSVYQEDINGLGTSHGPGNYSRLVIEGAGNTFVASGATLEPNLVNVTGSDTYVPYVRSSATRSASLRPKAASSVSSRTSRSRKASRPARVSRRTTTSATAAASTCSSCRLRTTATRRFRRAM